MIREYHKRGYFTEADKGYSRAVYKALDDTYVSEWDNKVDQDFITDNVELFIWNTREYYDEIFNTRRKAHSVAYAGLLGLFQGNVSDAEVKVRVTSEMVKQWFKKHGLDYVKVLKPIVDRIEEERAERKAEKAESLKKRSSIREGAYGRDAKYMYVLKHGFGPGTIPRDVIVYEYEDRPDGTTLIWVDRPFTYKELKEYDIPSETQLRRYLGSDYDRYFGESVKSKRITEDYKFPALHRKAMNLYNANDWSSFNNFSDDELAKLWSMCAFTEDNPFGAAYDDEVFEAIYDRDNSDEIFAISKRYL